MQQDLRGADIPRPVMSLYEEANMSAIKKFDAFQSNATGVQFFVPSGDRTFEDGLPCDGFGCVKYEDGTVYLGDLHFNGKAFVKCGSGRLSYGESELGVIFGKSGIGKSFFVGEFGGNGADDIYGDGVLYYRNAENYPACFVKGFFDGIHKTGAYQGAWSDSLLSDGYTPDMERDFTERDALFAWESENLSCMTELDNLFIGDSYFEFWNRRRFSQVLFCEKYDTSRNGNIGLGGTTFVDWLRYIPKLSAVPQPKKIFINLGFNDIHTGARAEVVFENYKRVLSMLKKMFPNSAYYLLNVVCSPCYVPFYAEEEKFNTLAKSSSHDCGVNVVDMRAAIGGAGQKENVFYNDGIHLNIVGYRIFSSVIAQTEKI